jgi:hypothetical protein
MGVAKGGPERRGTDAVGRRQGERHPRGGHVEEPDAFEAFAREKIEPHHGRGGHHRTTGVSIYEVHNYLTEGPAA